jgi:hypothetical protein
LVGQQNFLKRCHFGLDPLGATRSARTTPTRASLTAFSPVAIPALATFATPGAGAFAFTATAPAPIGAQGSGSFQLLVGQFQFLLDGLDLQQCRARHALTTAAARAITPPLARLLSLQAVLAGEQQYGN